MYKIRLYLLINISNFNFLNEQFVGVAGGAQTSKKTRA